MTGHRELLIKSYKQLARCWLWGECSPEKKSPFQADYNAWRVKQDEVLQLMLEIKQAIYPENNSAQPNHNKVKGM